MRLKILVSASLLAPVCLASAVWAATPANLKHKQAVRSAVHPLLVAEASWKEFSPAKGSFTILMPGTPTEDEKGYPTFTAQTNSCAFVISFGDIPDDLSKATPDDLGEVLDRASDELGKDGDQLLSKRNISLDKYPGREVEYKTSDGVKGIARIYLVKQRVYTLLVMPANDKDAKKFLDSFSLKQR